MQSHLDARRHPPGAEPERDLGDGESQDVEDARVVEVGHPVEALAVVGGGGGVAGVQQDAVIALRNEINSSS